MSDEISSMALSRDGTLLACGNVRGSLMIWDWESGALRLSIPEAHGDSIKMIVFSSDNGQVVTCGLDNRLRYVSLPLGAIVLI